MISPFNVAIYFAAPRIFRSAESSISKQTKGFLRKYSLVSLQIHTAATNHTIEGLPVAQAERLRETIMTLVEVVKDDL